jgi:hypothetical protein
MSAMDASRLEICFIKGCSKTTFTYALAKGKRVISVEEN